MKVVIVITSGISKNDKDNFIVTLNKLGFKIENCTRDDIFVHEDMKLLKFHLLVEYFQHCIDEVYLNDRKEVF
jgi:hypothetical protein